MENQNNNQNVNQIGEVENTNTAPSDTPTENPEKTVPENQAQVHSKVSKPFYKTAWFWVLTSLGTILLIIIIVFSSMYYLYPSRYKSYSYNNYDSTLPVEKQIESAPAETITEKFTERPTEVPTTKPTEAPTKSEQQLQDEFIKSCQTIDYKTLSRNPDKFKGQHFKFTGKVIQVYEDKNTFLRVNVTPEENEFADGGYLWSDTILCTVNLPEDSDRILEDDIIDIYGTCQGLYTYDSVLSSKISLPKIDISYYHIHQ